MAYTVKVKAEGEFEIEFDTRGQARKVSKALDKAKVEHTVTVNKEVKFTDEKKPKKENKPKAK